MKTLCLLFICSFFINSPAFAEWKKGQLKDSTNHVLIYEQYQTKTSKGPTLLFLPGIYRGLMSSDAFTQNLIKAKVPFVLMHFAEQPDSIVESPREESPDFSKVTMQTLADEVQSLSEQLDLKSVVPVTLSYSAIITASLDPQRFPVVIETSPISRQKDTLPPAVAQFYDFWEAWMKTMPYGAEWVLATKRAQLRQHWTDWLQGYKERLPQLNDPEYMERAVQGYTALTLAADDFDLRNQDFQKGPKRFFILGTKEDSNRAAVQKEAIEKYQKETGHTNNVRMVEGAGHIISADKPEEYVQTLKEILKDLR